MEIDNMENKTMRKSNELQIGKAGEYLVCADLILKDLIAYPSEQGLPYDVVIDNGKRLLKCQVKTTLQPNKVPQRVKESRAYRFSIKRHGKKNQSIYSLMEVDLFALVCLDTKLIGYLKNKEMPSTINIRADALIGQHRDEKGIQDYKRVKELSKTITNQSEIARRLNIHLRIVNKMMQPRYKPYKTNARYFSELQKDTDWFLEL